MLFSSRRTLDRAEETIARLEQEWRSELEQHSHQHSHQHLHSHQQQHQDHHKAGLSTNKHHSLLGASTKRAHTINSFSDLVRPVFAEKHLTMWKRVPDDQSNPHAIPRYAYLRVYASTFA